MLIAHLLAEENSRLSNIKSLSITWEYIVVLAQIKSKEQV